MKYIEITFKTILPVILSTNSGDSNMVETSSYISGTTIMGVFANKYIKSNKVDDNFYSLFLRGGLIFQNAYPLKDNDICYPVPYCLQKEKLQESIIHNIFINKPENQTKNIGSFGFIKNNQITTANIDKTIYFHHKHDRETGSTQTGVIFNYTCIKEGTVFKSIILSNDESNLKTIKKMFENQRYIYIGRSKTSQYGKCEIVLGTDIKEYKTTDNNKKEVIMTLLSDAIIYNESGYSVVDIKDLAKEIGVELSEIKNSIIRKNRTENFVSVWKNKKVSENTFTAGSCFLLKTLPTNFKQLEELGIGERTNEGFGKVSFEYVNAENSYSIVKFESQKNNLNINEMPELTKKIITAHLLKSFENEIILKAFETANEFNKNRISNSLCSRLQYFVETESFNDNFKLLKDTAKKNIERCNNNKITLTEFIEDIDNKFKNILTQIKINVKANETEMKKVFLTNFFVKMRKNNITEGKHEK